MTERRAEIEHRVRTELTTISIASQLIRRADSADERQRRLADEILEASRRLEHYLDEWFGAEPAEPFP